MEITIFALKMAYLGHKMGHYGPHLLLSLNFLMILAENLIDFLKVFIFFKNHQIWLSCTCLCIVSNISDSKIGTFWPQFWPENHTSFFLFIETIKDCLKNYFTPEIWVFKKYSEKSLLKPLEIAFLPEKWPLLGTKMGHCKPRPFLS